VLCWCDLLVRVEPRTTVVILQHPAERRKAIGTGRMAAQCIAGSRLHVGETVAACPGLDRDLSDPARPAWLLFPGPGAKDVDESPPEGRITLLVIDGTWTQASRMVRRDPVLSGLPRLSLDPDEPSRYRIRRQPRGECLSTIEALAHVLGVLEGDPDGMRRLHGPFAAMVQRHVDLREGRRVPRYAMRKAARRAVAL
jgi:DTW domain-containing protein YfiP